MIVSVDLAMSVQSCDAILAMPPRNDGSYDGGTQWGSCVGGPAQCGARRPCWRLKRA